MFGSCAVVTVVTCYNVRIHTSVLLEVGHVGNLVHLYKYLCYLRARELSVVAHLEAAILSRWVTVSFRLHIFQT